MAFFIDSKRIPPERLVFQDPSHYDRMMNTMDIDGARASVKQPKPEIHGNSLKCTDIPGAQPKKSIRSLWGEYDYNPLERNFQKTSDHNK